MQRRSRPPECNADGGNEDNRTKSRAGVPMAATSPPPLPLPPPRMCEPLPHSLSLRSGAASSWWRCEWCLARRRRAYAAAETSTTKARKHSSSMMVPACVLRGFFLGCPLFGLVRACDNAATRCPTAFALSRARDPRMRDHHRRGGRPGHPGRPRGAMRLRRTPPRGAPCRLLVSAVCLCLGGGVQQSGCAALPRVV